MKKLIQILPLIVILFIGNAGYANGYDNDKPDESSKVNIWVPGFLIKMVAGIAEDHVDGQDADSIDLLSKFGNTTICVREGEYYKDKTDKKMTRKLNRMERKNYEELMSVVTENEQVNMSIKENKRGKIKRMVILVDEKDETYVYLKMNCKLQMEDIQQVCDQYINN